MDKGKGATRLTEILDFYAKGRKRLRVLEHKNEKIVFYEGINPFRVRKVMAKDRGYGNTEQPFIEVRKTRTMNGIGAVEEEMLQNSTVDEKKKLSHAFTKKTRRYPSDTYFRSMFRASNVSVDL